MNNRTTYLAVACTLIFALMLSVAYAGETPSTGWTAPCESRDVIGRYIINNDRDYLGTINDLVIDHQGRVSLVVISYGGFLGIGERSVAIPWSALTFNSEDRLFVLNMSKDALAAAPAFDRASMASRSWSEDVYRYFGQQPYWTEGGGSSSTGH